MSVPDSCRLKSVTLWLCGVLRRRGSGGTSRLTAASRASFRLSTSLSSTPLPPRLRLPAPPQRRPLHTPLRKPAPQTLLLLLLLLPLLPPLRLLLPLLPPLRLLLRPLRLPPPLRLPLLRLPLLPLLLHLRLPLGWQRALGAVQAAGPRRRCRSVPVKHRQPGPGTGTRRPQGHCRLRGSGHPPVTTCGAALGTCCLVLLCFLPSIDCTDSDPLIPQLRPLAAPPPRIPGQRPVPENRPLHQRLVVGDEAPPGGGAVQCVPPRENPDRPVAGVAPAACRRGAVGRLRRLLHRPGKRHAAGGVRQPDP